MRSEYDFSKSRKNPYAKRLKREVTIRLETGVRNLKASRRRKRLRH
jgi:hypothetical protein